MEFVYKGRFDCLVSKKTVEAYVKDLYLSLRSRFKVKWAPKHFVVIMEINPRKEKGWGGNNWYEGDTFTLQMQLFGFPKREQTFRILQRWLGDTLTHEMLHLFIPSVQGNSCWTEGVVEFMTFWVQGTIRENLVKTMQEYKEITDEAYKQHKYGYVVGFKKMNALYEEDPGVLKVVSKMISDNTRKVYTKADILAYDARFRIFFTGGCNRHVPHNL